MKRSLKNYFKNQGFFSDKPLKVEDLTFNLNNNYFNYKPKQAFWTSTVRKEDGRTGWMDFCEDAFPERFEKSKLYRVKLKDIDNIRILKMDIEGILSNRYDEFLCFNLGEEIMNMDDIPDRYKYFTVCLDYNKVAEQYDIVHFPVYHGALLFSNIFKTDLQEHFYRNVFYLTDCECTIFLNSNFIEDIVPYE